MLHQRNLSPLPNTVTGAIVLALVGCLKSGEEESPRPPAQPSPAQIREEISPRPDAGVPSAAAFLQQPETYREAPDLARRVAAGQLPPLASRLPENPLVIAPLESIGRYGGTIRRALTDDTIQATGIVKTLNENLLGYRRPIADGVELNLAESYAFEDDGRAAVFKLREGIKWSDGVPLTVDDLLFGYYDIFFDPEARPQGVPPSVWMSGGRPIKVEKVDDLTLRFSADRPLGRVLQALCGNELAYPRHHYAEFHPKYNPKANYADLRSRLSEANRVMQPGVPLLSAWIPTSRVRAQRIVYERNPYYWKVDTEGNQLPYADGLEFEIIPDPQIMLLKFLNQEFDLFGRYTLIDMVETLRAAQDKGAIELHLDGPDPGPAFYLNWDAPNQALAEAFRDKRVRMALSHAINREEINGIIFHGLLKPGGFAFSPGASDFSDEAFRRYSSYDPSKARALLDEAGYRDRDQDGFRELRDGSRFELTMDVQVQGGHADVCELVAEHWLEIGIKTHLYITVEMNTFPRRVNGEFEVYVWNVMEGADPLASPHLWGPTTPNSPFWHRNAATEGPPWLAEATRQMQIALTTIDPEAHHKAMAVANDLQSENVPVIALGSAYKPWASNRRLGNVPKHLSPFNHVRGWSRPVFHEQIYIQSSRE
jgi:peptide/nickel transport system substrate-binding protein